MVLSRPVPISTPSVRKPLVGLHASRSRCSNERTFVKKSARQYFNTLVTDCASSLTSASSNAPRQLNLRRENGWLNSDGNGMLTEPSVREAMFKLSRNDKPNVEKFIR